MDNKNDSLPFYSIIPVIIAISMVWVFLTVFNALRFTQCSSWVDLSAPPGRATALSGTMRDWLYIETMDHSVYCLKSNQWSSCTLPSNPLEPDNAPDWLKNNFLQKENILQWMRGDGFTKITYYLLSDNGNISSCSTDFIAEVEKIVLSPLFLLLLIPVMIGSVCFVVWVNIFVKSGAPTM